MSSAFIRAVTPPLASLTNAAIAMMEHSGGIDNTTAADIANITRQTAIMGVGSVHELIELIPADYRHVLADHLRALLAHGPPS